MVEVIKKSLNLWDYFIIIAACFLLTHLDYANLTLSDKFYLVTFVLWFIMLAVRIFIRYKNEVEK